MKWIVLTVTCMALSNNADAQILKNNEAKDTAAPQRLQTSGKGEDEPIGDNKTMAGKAQNRRVEFVRLK